MTPLAIAGRSSYRQDMETHTPTALGARNMTDTIFTTLADLQDRIADEAANNNGHVMGYNIGADWQPLCTDAQDYLAGIVNRAADWNRKTIMVDTDGFCRHLRLYRDEQGYYVREGKRGMRQALVVAVRFVAQTPSGYTLLAFATIYSTAARNTSSLTSSLEGA